MIDPIDPVAARAKPATVQETQAVEAVALRPDQHPLPDAPAHQDAAGGKQTDAARALHHVVPSRPGFEVHIDGATLRMYSEMRDPATNRVVMRLPAGYQPQHEPQPSLKRIEFET